MTYNTDEFEKIALMQYYLKETDTDGKIIYQDEDGEYYFSESSADMFGYNFGEDVSALIPLELLPDAQKEELAFLMALDSEKSIGATHIVQLCGDGNEVIIVHEEVPKLFANMELKTLAKLKNEDVDDIINFGTEFNGDLTYPKCGDLMPTTDGEMLFVIY